MGKTCEISIQRCMDIVNTLKNGKSYRSIARFYEMNFETVRQICEKFKETGSIANKPCTGRPSKTSVATDHAIVREVKKNRRISAGTLVANVKDIIKTDISEHTIRRRIKEAGFAGQIAQKKSYISDKNRQARLQFAKTHRAKP